MDFSLADAGYLGITVVNDAGQPVPGVVVTAYVPETGAMATWPTKSNDRGRAYLGQVPLRSKIGLGPAPGYVNTWLGGTDLANATVISIAASGGVADVVGTIRRA